MIVLIQGEVDYSWVREDVFSFVSSMDSSLHIYSLYMHHNVVSKEFYEKVKLLPCKEDDHLFIQADSNTTPFFFFYRDLVSVLGVSFSTSNFQSELLTRLNLTPSQLHTNSGAMVRIFQVLSLFLNIRSSVSVFMFFFEMRLIGKTGWVSLNVVLKRLFKYNVNVFW